MRKSLIAIAAVAVSAGAATAADLARYTKAPPPVPAPIYNWTGFYVGGNGGYGWSRDKHEDLLPGFGGFWTSGWISPLGPTQTIKPQGAVYGGQIGYNWQAGSWVFGLEGQFNGADIKRNDVSIFFPVTDRLRAKIDTFATVTGRIGYASSNWLPYIKAGYAGANLKTSNFDIFGRHLDNKAWRSGFVVGAGLEYGFAGNWSVGVEYDYMVFGSKSFEGPNLTSSGTRFGAERFSDDLRISTVTGRLNYRFGGPVVARY
ncbi:MAG TPA: outer membrane beta-barrel protein [Xanthobacteraceae bacterium]|nr:outer membrane beta-barrel protein [Xanthobacteraceae bacterium]